MMATSITYIIQNSHKNCCLAASSSQNMSLIQHLKYGIETVDSTLYRGKHGNAVSVI